MAEVGTMGPERMETRERFEPSGVPGWAVHVRSARFGSGEFGAGVTRLAKGGGDEVYLGRVELVDDRMAGLGACVDDDDAIVSPAS